MSEAERCPDCQWVEVRQLCQVEPDVVRGEPCPRHAESLNCPGS